jgi:nitroimidazol reductase NimA-like FMN-containing flavoprotein (pyridoxamine 5'-phosphate oxidase superfamily)
MSMAPGEILRYCAVLAAGQQGGTLATSHAEDGTPYVTFVLFHLTDDGRILFGSAPGSQHSRNILATPEVSFLIDNREVIRTDWTAFDRVVIEGRARRIAPDDSRYLGLLAELAQKNGMAARIADEGLLFCVEPRRISLARGLGGAHIVDFED